MTHLPQDGSALPRARYMRPDAGRYIRPDALRFIRPDVARILAPGTGAAECFPAINLKFRADQRRVPAGQPGGGRWIDMLTTLILGLPSSSGNSEQDEDDESSDGDDESGSETSATDAFRNAYASDIGTADTNESIGTSITTDELIAPETVDPGTGELIRAGGSNTPVLNEFGEPYYKPGGHHEMPRAIYEKWDLTPETRQVFQDSTTGTLPKTRTSVSPDGELRGHFWDGPHRDYNDAVKELSEKYLRENDIMETRRMSPDQARDLLKEIRESDDPKIREFNRTMRNIGRAYRGGTGRGNQ